MQALSSRPGALVRPSTRPCTHAPAVTLSPAKPRTGRWPGVVARDAADQQHAEARPAHTQPPQAPQQHQEKHEQEYGIQRQPGDGQQSPTQPRSKEEGMQSIRRLNDYFSAMQRDMDVLMDSFLTTALVPEFMLNDPFFKESFAGSGGGALRKGTKELKEMAWDTNETDTEYVLVAHVPGFSKDEIKVTLGGANVLTIQGEHKVVEELKNGGRGGRARQQKTFFRRLWLPHNVDTERIAAKVEHGVLEITVPKKTPQKPEDAPKVIQVA